MMLAAAPASDANPQSADTDEGAVTMTRVITSAVFFVSLTLLAGRSTAAELKYTKQISVRAGENHHIFFDDPLVEKATVIVKSPGTPVNVYIVLQTDVDAAIKAIENGKTPRDVLASSEKTEDKTFDVAPGKKKFAVILTAPGNKAEVVLTASGK